MNVVQLKPKNNNPIELHIREGTGSFMCISCSEDSDVVFHRLQAQADHDVVLGPERFGSQPASFASATSASGTESTTSMRGSPPTQRRAPSVVIATLRYIAP